MKNLKHIFKIYSKWNPSKIVVILMLSIPFLYYIFNRFYLDNDFWFLINTGRTILKEGFINLETFTFHNNLSFIPQQWLTDVIFYLIYKNFSVYGMFILIFLSNILIIFLIYKLSTIVSNNAKKISIIITIVIDCSLLILCITTRPQLFDIIFFLLELLLIELYKKNDKKIFLYFLPVISLILINMHASMWLMFFAFLLPYYGEYIYNKIKKQNNFKIKYILIITVISLLFGLINPYGLSAVTYLFRSYGVSYINKYILEMMPVTINRFLLTYIFIYIVLFSFYYNKGIIKISHLLLFLGTTFLGLLHVKGLLFTYIGMIIPLAYNFRLLFKENVKSIQMPAVFKGIYITIIIIFFVFIGLFLKIEKESDMLLYEVANYLDKNNVSVNDKVYTSYVDGSYLEYRGYKCYLDPRAEVFLKKNNHQEDILLEYFNLQYNDGLEQDFLDKYNFDYLVLDKNDVLHKYMQYTDNYLFMEEFKNNDYQYTIYKRK